MINDSVRVTAPITLTWDNLVKEDFLKSCEDAAGSVADLLTLAALSILYYLSSKMLILTQSTE